MLTEKRHFETIKRLEKIETKKTKGLSLDNLKLIDLPSNIKKYYFLEELDLSNNLFENIPNEIKYLTNLKYLDLSDNKISNIPNWIIELEGLETLVLSKNAISGIDLNFENLKNLTELRLDNNKFNTIPECIFNLMYINELDLSHNEIKAIPKEIKKLNNLIRLDLSFNHIEFIPPEIGNLRRLTTLNLSNNKLISIPKSINKLNNLVWLMLNNNLLSNLPEELFFLQVELKSYRGLNDDKRNMIFLDGNPIETPPIEILNKGLGAIKNYFSEISGKEDVSLLYEAKLLIVGEPGAGKTSFSRKFLNPESSLPKDDETTRGIDISPYKFNITDEKKFIIHIWDFGGQEIYHSTHQFFLTKRSLYVLISDNRSENTQFKYWLNVIELLSDKSPLLIIQNEKQNRKRELSENEMRGRFSNLIRIMQTNLATNRGLDSIRRQIKNEVQNLPHIGSKLPKAWIAIRKQLEEESNQNPFIRDVDYFKICESNGIADKDRSRYLSEFLHDLGVFLHFQDSAILRRWLILKPTWGTDAVYRIIDNIEVINQNGWFNKYDAKRIWHEKEYEDMHEELLELMKKFELCYEIENTGKYIIPQLLKEKRPEYELLFEESLVIKYQYMFMPKGIMTRLIVRMHKFIDNQNLVWRSGVVLEREGAIAEIIETYAEDEIVVKVAATNRKELFTIIVDALDDINSSYKEIKLNKLIPCNCTLCDESASPYFYKYDSLKTRLKKKKTTIECDISYDDVSIISMLEEFISLSKMEELYPELKNIPLIFISYSHKDNQYREDLRNWLKPLAREQKLKIWDDQSVDLGKEWAKEINVNLENAQIIILLVSVDFLASDYCYSIELKKAIEKHKKNEAIVIPIIIRDCNWHETPFSKLQIPFGGDPLSNFDNIDSRYKSIVKDIEMSLIRIKNKPLNEPKKKTKSTLEKQHATMHKRQ